MKLSFIMLFISFGLASATQTYSQSVTLNINLENKTVQEVLDQIEQQSEFTFFYNNNQIDTDRTITIESEDSDVFTLLSQIFENTDVTYKVLDKSIILSTRNLDTAKKTQTTQEDNKRKITGNIKDEAGLSVIGANILVKGVPGLGAITDLDGNFELNVPNEATLLITSIGYTDLELKVGVKAYYEITLAESNEYLSELVVTALGIKREEKALGYSVQNLTGDEILTSKSVDVASMLTGKIAGLNIQNSTEHNQAPTIILRGETPLLIIDGIPYGNMTLNEIAADDIESIDVLKGATASALYGARGSSGAIMVTTKKGADSDGLTIDINSNTTFSAGYLSFPKTHSSYSSGSGGKQGMDSGWGDKLDIGRTSLMYDPITYEWREMELTSKGKNNFKNFLESSLITNNNVSVSQKGKYGSFRTSLTHVYNKGQYQNQELNKITYTVGGELILDKFKMDASATYNKRVSSNDNGKSYTGSYIYDLVIWGAPQYDINEFENYWVEGKEGQQQNWYDPIWYDNPWFKANECLDAYDTDVFNAHLNASYEITPWLKAMLRGGLDFYSERNEWRNPISANNGGWDKLGLYGLSRNSKSSINADAILMADKSWGKFNMNALVGGNMYNYSNDQMRSTTQGGLTVPGFYSLAASKDPIDATSALYRKRVNSIYGKLSLSWASTYFLDVTARNDWSSTLSSDNRSYFYPSVAGSVVLSEIINLPKVWDFWKIRGSWTTSKQDASIYANNNAYDVETNYWDGLGVAEYPNSIIGNNIRPKTTVSFEVGTAVNFFKNRLYADFAYYRKVESDFIVNGGVSGSTGFGSIQVNSEEERLRSGYEITVGGTPIETKNFTWNILTNWGHDKYVYHKLDPKYSSKYPWVKEGESWNWISVYDWERDLEGNVVHNGGLPQRQSFITKVGNTTPDLVWGITNTFKYKAFTLSFTIDGRVGGKSYSSTNQMMWNSGTHIESDTPERYEEVVNGKLTYVGKGVKLVSGTAERDPYGTIISDNRVFAPNDQTVSYESYISTYHSSVPNPREQNILDETFFKLRHLSLTYDLPETFCQKIKMKGASVSFIGQNLFLWTKEYKYADPDRGGNADGNEYLNAPSQRYLGFNIKVTF